MMTDQQKSEIESLRKEGLSYRQIAEKVGVTPACIKTFFHRKRIRDATRLCEQCHKPIITTVNRSNRRFCSTECKSRWWYQQRTGRVVQPSAKIKVPASPVNMQIIDADQNSLGDGLTGYIASVAVAGVMLNNGLISKREFLALEKQFLESTAFRRTASTGTIELSKFRILRQSECLIIENRSDGISDIRLYCGTNATPVPVLYPATGCISRRGLHHPSRGLH